MIYEYECQNCGHREEKSEPIGPGKILKCPSCKKKKMERIISACIGFCKREANTIGQVIERNNSKLGRYEREERGDPEARAKEAKLRSEKEQLDKINKMSDKQKEKFIREG